MHVSIDWLSFSGIQDENHYDNPMEALYAAMQTIHYALGDGLTRAVQPEGWKPGVGRRPYNISFRGRDNGIAVYAHHKLPHFLVELSGTGCEALRQAGALDELLQCVTPRVTRIDIACDMETDTDPMAFANRRDKGRFKSGALIRSEDGATVVIGSKTSNRWAKVYRYNEPHPRHKLLRAEHTFKGEDGKAAAVYICQNGLEAMAVQCQQIFGWKHPNWDVSTETDAELTAHRADRDTGKTVYWLYETVGPLMARLISEGKFDPADFWEKGVIPHMPTYE